MGLIFNLTSDLEHISDEERAQKYTDEFRAEKLGSDAARSGLKKSDNPFEKRHPMRYSWIKGYDTYKAYKTQFKET